MSPRRLLDEPDPVAAFLAAHAASEPIALPTSGTRDRPRTVVRSTGSWVRSFDAFSELAGLGSTARVWIPGPLGATMNLFAAVHARWVGAGRADRPTEATHLALTPTALRRLLDDGIPLTGLTVVVAGDSLAVGLRERAERAGARVAHYYGAAELSFVAWGRDASTLEPFPGVELDLRPDPGSSGAGVVWARSPYLADAVEGEPGPYVRDAAGFASVGDRSRWDGYRLTVLGRDETVVTGGSTVLLADVEATLRPVLRGDVAVVGLPHPRLGTVVAAVLTDGTDTSRARERGRTLGAGRPRRWFCRPELPLTPAGKVDRRALVEQLRRAP